ncbi:MAG: hypothetical protein P1V34_05270 [Alphaproteobacteria bacterium]|nr:hypothetical protein [Alphaproteobacteria bacterium]
MPNAWGVVCRKSILMGTVCAPLLLSACAQGINPKPAPPDYREAKAAEDRIIAEDYTFEIALAYMEIAKNKMRDYADGPTKTRNLTGAGAVLAAVGAAAAVIFDAHEDLYFGLGLAGGSLFAASNLYGNPAFERIYENGLSALACVDHKLRPAMVAGASITSAEYEATGKVSAVQNALTPIVLKLASAKSSKQVLVLRQKRLKTYMSAQQADVDAVSKRFNQSSATVDTLATAKAQAKAAEVVLADLNALIAQIEYRETILSNNQDYGDKSLTAAAELSDQTSEVSAMELKMATDIIVAVDNIFIQVRNRIREVDPGSQGIANTVALINGFSKLPDGKQNLQDLTNQPAVPAAPEMGDGTVDLLQTLQQGQGNEEGLNSLLAVRDADAVQLDLDAFDAERKRLSDLYLSEDGVTQPEALVLSDSELGTLNTAVRDLSYNIVKASRQLKAVKETATQTVDISSCNVEGATIPQFELLNQPVVAEEEETPATPQFDVAVADQGETIFTLSVRGGQPNYGYEVLGSTPPGVSIMQTRSGTFFVRAASTTRGTLSLNLFDSLNGSKTVILNFVEKGTGDQGSGMQQSDPFSIVKSVIAIDTSVDTPKGETMVTGGKSPYTVKPPDRPTGGVTVVVEDSGKVTITAPKDADFGELVYKIKDANGHYVDIKLIVKPGATN